MLAAIPAIHADLDRALTALLAAIVKHDARQINPSDHKMQDMSEPYRPVADAAEAWASRPIRKALKIGVREIGKLAYTTGGDSLMQTMADRQYDEPNGPRRATILNSAWDDIGSWVA